MYLRGHPLLGRSFRSRTGGDIARVRRVTTENIHLLEVGGGDMRQIFTYWHTHPTESPREWLFATETALRTEWQEVRWREIPGDWVEVTPEGES